MAEFCQSTPRVTQRLDDLESTICRLDGLWVLAETSSQRQTEIENRLARINSVGNESEAAPVGGLSSRGAKLDDIVEGTEIELSPSNIQSLFTDMAMRIRRLETEIVEVRNSNYDSKNSCKQADANGQEDHSGKEDVLIGMVSEDKFAEKESQEVLEPKQVSSGRLSTMSVAHLREDKYALRESIWDLSVFLGHPILGSLGSVYITFCLLMTIAVILVFNGIISADLTNPSAYGEIQQKQLHKWRTHFGHLLDTADPVTGTSLVAAVCEVDKSLMTSSPHVSIVNNLVNYLPGDGSGILEHLESGPVLCLLALFVWYLILIEEITTVVDLSRSILDIERKKKMIRLETHGTRLVVTSMGWVSLTIGIVFSLSRVALCVMLANSGTMFILHTISMQDLILNCAALRIVLDMDELMFEVLMPLHARCFLANLEPFPTRAWPERSGLDVWTLFSLVSVLSAVGLVGWLRLLPFVDDLEKTYDIICGGDKDFVVKADIAGRPWATRSNPFGEHIPPYERILAHAVGQALEGKFDNSIATGELSWGGYGTDHFGQDEARPIDDVERLRRLTKKNKFTTFSEYSQGYTAEGKHSQHPAVVHLRNIMLNDTVVCEGIHHIHSGTSCYQLWGEQIETTLRIQAMCPDGCGCSSVFTGTLYTQLGCPVRSGHSKGFQAELATLPCEDPGAHSSSSSLQRIRDWMKGPEIQQFCEYHVNHESSPCPDPAAPHFCDTFYKHFHKMHTVFPAICPIRFGCHHGNNTDDHLLYCPVACRYSPHYKNTTS